LRASINEEGEEEEGKLASFLEGASIITWGEENGNSSDFF